MVLISASAASGSGPNWSILISVAGGVVTTLIGVFVGSLLTRKTQQRQWLLDYQAQASSTFLREYQKVSRAMRKSFESNSLPDLDWRPWNEAVTILSLVADQKVVLVTQRIDNILWDVCIKLRDGDTAGLSWLALRSDIESAVRDFINLSRIQFGHGGMSVEYFHGRPGIEDGIWPGWRSGE